MNVREVESPGNRSGRRGQVTCEILLERLILIGCESLLVKRIEPPSRDGLGSQVDLPPCGSGRR